MAATPQQKFRIEQPLWDRFMEAVKRDPEADASKVLRSFCRWYAGDQDAQIPTRPPARRES